MRHLSRWTSAGSLQELLGRASSDGCARGGDTSSSRSLRPWPRTSTAQPHGQKTAKAGEGVRGEVHGQVPGALPPQAAGVQHFHLDDDEAPGQTDSLPCLDRRSGFCGTPWSSLSTACRSRRRSRLLRRRGVAVRLGACSALGSRSLLMLEYGLYSSKPRASTRTTLGLTRPGIGQRWRCCSGARTPVRSAILTLAQTASIASLLPRCGEVLRQTSAVFKTWAG